MLGGGNVCFTWVLIGYGRDAYGRLGRDEKERALLMVRRALCLFVRGECLIVELAELALDGKAAGPSSMRPTTWAAMLKDWAIWMICPASSGRRRFP